MMKLGLVIAFCSLAAGLRRLKSAQSNQTQWAESSQDQSTYVQCHKEDGFGAQYHCQMAAFAKARHDGQCFVLKSFANSGFHSNSKSMDGNRFTGLKTDDNCEKATKRQVCDTPYCAEGGKGVSIEQYYTKRVRQELRELYWSNPKPEVDTSCEVAVHVRAGDVWQSRKIPLPTIRDALDKAFANKKICIFSEGNGNSFGPLKSLKNVEFKLNAPVDETFHNLVAAPNMVIAKSSFSYTAGVLNTGRVFYISRFWHKMLPDWQQIPKSSSKKFAKVEEEEDPPADLSSSDYD